MCIYLAAVLALSVTVALGVTQQIPLAWQTDTEDSGGTSPGDLPFSTADLEEYIEDVMDRWHAPGMAVAVINGEHTWENVCNHWCDSLSCHFFLKHITHRPTRSSGSKLLIQEQGFGYASLDPKMPVTPHTLFYTGSTTKSFTAAGLSLLIDNASDYSNIKWETPVSQLLREDFVLSDDWATAVSCCQSAVGRTPSLTD